MKPTVPSSCPEFFSRLVEGCCQFEANERFTFSQICEFLKTTDLANELVDSAKDWNGSKKSNSNDLNYEETPTDSNYGVTPKEPNHGVTPTESNYDFLVKQSNSNNSSNQSNYGKMPTGVEYDVMKPGLNSNNSNYGSISQEKVHIENG